ncbi:MAG: ATP-binding protein, partial [Pirellulaceae bacterium]
RADALQQETELQVTANTGFVVHADRDQLAVALQALVRNALEALGSGGTVRLAAQRVLHVGRVRRLELSVEDSGPGIEPAVRSHLFDPFYSGREAGRGLGFGLSKAWRIVQEHGGTLRVEAVQPTGARFVLELPVEPRDASVGRGRTERGTT